MPTRPRARTTSTASRRRRREWRRERCRSTRSDSPPRTRGVSSIAARSPGRAARPTSMRSRPRRGAHAYLRTVDEPAGDGVPIALKDVISTHGVETTAGSRILEGYVPVFDATVAARVKAAGLPLLGKTNTDEFAMGSSTENSAWGPSRNPWTRPRPGRVGRRLGRGRERRPRALGARLGHGRLDQAAVGAVRQRRPAADVRDGVAVRRRRVRVEPRSDRPGGEDRARLRPAVLDHRRSRPARLDDRGVARGGAAGRRGPSAGCDRRAPRANEHPGIEPGVREAVAAAIALAEELGAEVGSASCRARSSTACPATT